MAGKSICSHSDILPEVVALFFILRADCCILLHFPPSDTGRSMHVTFSAEEIAFRDEVRRFFREQIPEDIHARQRQHVPLNREDQLRFQKALYARGWAGYNWPVEYGGTGWSLVQKYLFQKEMADANMPAIVPFGLGMVGPIIYTYGSEEQKQRFLPDILASNTWWCQGYSEPDPARISPR